MQPSSLTWRLTEMGEMTEKAELTAGPAVDQQPRRPFPAWPRRIFPAVAPPAAQSDRPERAESIERHPATRPWTPEPAPTVAGRSRSWRRALQQRQGRPRSTAPVVVPRTG